MKVKVIYIAVYDNNKKSGVSKKIMAQIRALKQKGVDAQLVMLSREKIEFPGELDVQFYKAIVPPFRSTREKIQFTRDFANAIAENAQTCDILYCRGVVPSPFLLKAMKRERRAGIVFEIQSIAENEARIRGSRMNLLMSRLFLPGILKQCDGIVGVTEEITRHYIAVSGVWDKLHLTNPNGIDVSSVPQRTPPDFDGKRLDLLCVAQVAKWHGLDRLIKGLAKYNGKTEVTLHIVGDGSEVPNLKKITNDLKLGDRVVFHGFKTGVELDELFDKCHIGIGSLAIHRAGAGSPLKSREYCARGIPFTCSAYDDDFPYSFPYRLKVLSNESSIDISEVIEFAKRVYSDPEHPQKMRRYAEANLDWSVKMRKLKDFLEKVLEERSHR